jgi:UDP:flavonoid glycosyltransferase YjiC (YdhE family)
MRIAFAWELGAGRGHAGPILTLASHLVSRGHEAEAYLHDLQAAAEHPEARDLSVQPSPRWVGPIQRAEALNYAELLINFGFHSAEALAQLVDAWRQRIAHADLVVSNVAPAAMVAARTLDLPVLEISQGYHVPPPGLPCPPFRDWQPAPRARLIASDRIVLQAINEVLARHGRSPIESIGDLFAGRTLLQTYPELEMYPERGPSEYFGIVPAKGRPMLDWPEGRPRILAYLYPYFEHLGPLLEAIAQTAGAAVVVCLGAPDDLRHKHESGSLTFADRLLDFPHMAADADLVVCHGSHQATAEALLVGRPLLLLPTQVEQFLTTQRVVRHGAALGIMPAVPNPDFSTALQTLLQDRTFATRAQAFARRYGAHRRETALDTLATRCEKEMSRRSGAAA